MLLSLGCGTKTENLMLSCIMHFIPLPIQTPPTVKQRWRKKEKGDAQRERDQTTGCRECSDNPGWQLQCPLVMPLASG